MENNNLIEQPTIEDKDHDHKFKITNIKRPVSYYENDTPENENALLSRNTNKERKFDNSPTQMHCLTTTVPQKIASENIAGKHTPTRNSLRHSRMIVLNRSGKAPAAYLPPIIIKYHKFVKALLVLITFLGIVLCTFSLLLLLWTSNIRSRDNPYWSALPVILSGLIGFIYLKMFPIGHHGGNLYWINSIKYTSIVTSLVAAMASFIICGFAVVHLVALATLTCSPPDKVNTTCMCRTNSTENSSILTSYHYVDLTCTEVNNILPIIISFICLTNVLAGICEILYLYLHWSCRISAYSRVQTKDNTDLVNKIDR